MLIACPENIDPDPAGSSGDCPARVDDQSWMNRCDCQYSANRKKCGTSPTCIDIATSERNACYGNCMSDFT